MNVQRAPVAADVLPLVQADALEIVLTTSATVLVASHDPQARKVADVIFELRDGSLVSTPSGEEELGT